MEAGNEVYLHFKEAKHESQNSLTDVIKAFNRTNHEKICWNWWLETTWASQII